jgi:hypothetical protein
VVGGLTDTTHGGWINDQNRDLDRCCCFDGGTVGGSLSGTPAYADDVPAEPVATTINLRYAAVDSTVTATARARWDAITELDLAVDGTTA